MNASHPAMPTWKRTLLAPSASIQDAIRNLNQTGLQIVLVTTPGGQLVGTLTDGDIRGGLLNGMRLDSPIEAIVHREAFVVPPEMARDSVLHIMRANKIHQVPVVDEQRTIIGLHLWDELVSPMARANLMVVMAGGLGTRLRPHTENCPKPLLPVAGKPMLEHIVDRAKSEGFTRFCFAIHYLGHMIEAHFGDGSRWGVSIDYLREEAMLGTAGALCLLPQRAGEPLVVSNGDVLTDIRYGELLDFHVRCDAAATMAVRLHEWQHPYGVVRTRGLDIVGFEEKPVMQSHVNAGIYVLQPQALKHLKGGERCDMPALFQRVREAGGRTVVYPMHEPWLDVGRPDDLSRAEDRLRSDGEAEVGA
jgi:dTDP-glucose pyrophosphorylase